MNPKHQTKISRIIVFTMRKDLRLTRICIASIRYWYPDIRIDIVKDEARECFCTKEIERYWGVGVERFGRDQVGGSGMLTKLEPLFLETREKVLLLDNDTVFAGPVLEILGSVDAEFIVSEDTAHGDLQTEHGRQIVAAFLFDRKKLNTLVPDFEFQNRMFNAGHIVITVGKLPTPFVSEFVDRGPPPSFRVKDVFQMGDQGFWNFALEYLHQKKFITLRYMDFAKYPQKLESTEFSIEGIKSRSDCPAVILHWAGMHDFGRIQDMPHAEILQFFEGLYYLKIRNGKIHMRIRAAQFYLRHGLSLLRRNTKAWLKVLTMLSSIANYFVAST